ncbi:MAG: type II secretion system protein [Sedimentisphaerales bacterium]|nr:type II secretion system protein [Sedimentisphaerales bacterium]
MRKKAFTLVELLVVIAIIAMLLSILVPSLQRARGLTKRLVCLSNLRQLSVAAQIYTNNYNDFYPFAMETLSGGGSSSIINCWDFMDPKLGKGKPGLLWQGDGIAKIQQCPDFKGAANWAGDPYTGYNYNSSYIGGSVATFGGIASSANGGASFAAKKPSPPTGSTEIIVRSSKTTELKHPAATALFGDGQWSGGANKFMRSPFFGPNDGGPGNWAGTQGFRHLGQTNVAYCDGSARPQKERYTQTEDPAEASNIAPLTGFLSPDNSAYDLE